MDNKTNTSRTGANQGIGYETAKNLIQSSADYHVILGSRDSSKGEAAAQALLLQADGGGAKGTVSSVPLDVTDEASIAAAAQRVGADFGRLDVLVNNAGIISTASPPTAQALRRVLETNVVGALAVTEEFLDLLRKAERKPPRLVFVSSSMGSITHAADEKSPYYNPHGTEYRTSKAALNMLMTMVSCFLPISYNSMEVTPRLSVSNCSLRILVRRQTKAGRVSGHWCGSRTLRDQLHRRRGVAEEQRGRGTG